MKTIRLKPLFIAWCVLSAYALQAQTFEWVATNKTTLGAFAKSVVDDNKGNIYTVGVFQDSIDLDPGPADLYYYSGTAQDFYVQKLDANKNLFWAGTLSGMSPLASCTDASGNLYVLGRYFIDIDVDPGIGVYTLAHEGSSDFFVLKLSGEGAVVWAKATPNFEYVTAMACDAVGNVCLAGGTGPDIVVLKLDGSGSVQWAHETHGTTARGEEIAVDMDGNVYSFGLFTGMIDADPGPGVLMINGPGMGLKAGLLQKFNASGVFQWAIKTVDTLRDQSCIGLTTDFNGNVYVSGRFDQISVGMDLDPGPGTVTIPVEALTSPYIQKFTGAGNLVWVKHVASPSILGFSMATGRYSEDIYFACAFLNSVEADPGTDTLVFYDMGGRDILVEKLDASGNLVWAGTIAGSNEQMQGDIAVDDADYVYVTGSYRGQTDFDIIPGSTVYQTAANGDVFLLKLAQPTSGVGENEENIHVSVYPNPTNGNITIDLGNVSGTYAVSVTDITGRTVIQSDLSTGRSTLNINGPAGLYMVTVTTAGAGSKTMKIIKH